MPNVALLESNINPVSYITLQMDLLLYQRKRLNKRQKAVQRMMEVKSSEGSGDEEVEKMRLDC